MVNGEDLIDESKKSIYNKFGNLSNYVSVPLQWQEDNIMGDISKFISQDINYIDNIDYPVFVSKESAVLMKMRSSKEKESLYSKIKEDFIQVISA